ncbi:MAG: hypothetical protein ACKV0T_11995 [Planctomycetales bacterium]
MSFLLDTNTLSAHVRRPSGLAHRFFQHSGRLYTASICLGELYVWAYGRPDPTAALLTKDFANISGLRLEDWLTP